MAKTVFQSFRLDLRNVADCVALIGEGVNTRRAIAARLGMGEKKVEGIFEWAEFMGLLEDQPRTQPQALKPLGRFLLAYPGFLQSLPVLQLLYAEIAMRHPLIAGIVNGFIYDISRRFNSSFELGEFRQAVLSVGEQFDVTPDFLSRRSGIYLDVLTNPTSLGKLGIVGKTGPETFRVNPHNPDWRAAAYILYSSWPHNTSRMRITDVASGRSGLGRIFLLRHPQVMALLAKLEQERAIALEIVADLRQIGPNPSMRAEDFLEMLLHD